MAVLSQLGTSLNTGAGTITGSYVVERLVENGKEVGFSDIFDENGALLTRLIKYRHVVLELDLICVLGAVPGTDFPEGELAAHADFTSFYVEAAPVTKIGDAERVSVRLRNLSI